MVVLPILTCRTTCKSGIYRNKIQRGGKPHLGSDWFSALVSKKQIFGLETYLNVNKE